MPFSKTLSILLLNILLVLPALGQFRSNEAAEFAQAEKYYELGMQMTDRFEKARYLDYAVGIYKKYLRNHPRGANGPAVYHHLGRAQQSLGDIREAKHAYNTMIQKYRRGNYVGLSSLQMAWLAYTNEDWNEAADHFRLASTEITADQLRQGALTKRAECLLKTHRTEEVRGALTTIIQSQNHPHQLWARFMLGYQYFQDEQYRLTIATLKPMLEEKVANNYRSQAMFYTGLAATELGQGDDGEEYLRQVLALQTAKPGLTAEQRRQISHNKTLSQTALMKLHSQKGDFEEVLKLYGLGDFGARGKIEARRSMTAGNAFYHFKRFHDARSAFRRVDRSAPNTPLAFDASYKTLLCDYQLKQASLPERVDAFLELYRSNFPSHENIHMAHILKAETLYTLGEFEQAATAYAKVDSRMIPASHRPSLFYKSGWCFAEMGDNNGAALSFSKFLKQFPDDSRTTEALAKRAESYFFLGDRTSALRDYEAILNQNTQPELISFALQGSARVLRDEKKYALMVKRYRRLLSEFNDLPADTTANANYWIGWGYFKDKKYKEAAPYLKKAQQLIPEFYNEPAGNLLVLLTFSEADVPGMNEALKKHLSDFPGKLIPTNMLTWLGMELFHRGNFTDAARFLERATSPEKPNSSDVSIWRTLAKSQNELGQFNDALATSRIVLKLENDPRWRADTYLDIAQAQLGLQDFDSALKSAQDGLAINAPGAHTSGLHQVIGKVSYQKGAFEDALSSFETTSNIVFDDPVITPAALLWAARSAEKLNDPERAATFRQQLASRFPTWQAPEDEGSIEATD
ncbi:MAG: tetratricopeptide repeat protein [Akkermansiaceae bacterium]